MEVKTIKGVSEERWMEFKSLAAKKRVPLGSLFEIMLEDYFKNADSFWEKVLNGKKILSEKEAEELKKDTKKLRRDSGFRI